MISICHTDPFAYDQNAENDPDSGPNECSVYYGSNIHHQIFLGEASRARQKTAHFAVLPLIFEFIVVL